MPEDAQLPKGLVFFSPQASPRRKRRRTLFVVIVLAAALALVWPVYPPFGGIRPLVLGLPFSLVWVVLWLFVVFAALVWLYRTEDDGRQTADRSSL